MSNVTAIEWTDTTWNPVTGCTKISAGCDHCYAERFSERFRGTPGHPFEGGFDLTLRPERIEQPLLWRKPRMVFVNSMSDLFHKQVPREFISKVFDTMEKADWHTFQVLTKRSSIMRNFLRARYGNGRGPTHIWCGVSVEDGRRKSRIQHLQETPAGVRFLSIEPLIAHMGVLNLDGIDWVIVGGESGPGAREMRVEWVRDIRDQCTEKGIAFFFKQWGGIRPKSGGRALDGREWDQLASIGSYKYVAETTVLKPLSDRALYCLCYATRHPKGIEVFRDCQLKALQEQAKTRAATKVKHAEATTGQREIFESLHDMAPNDLEAKLTAAKIGAEKTFLELTPIAPETAKYEDVWPRVLAKHVVRLPDVNQIAARLRKEQRIIFPDWEPGKRVPQPNYKMHK